jgi:hypothetical protein
MRKEIQQAFHFTPGADKPQEFIPESLRLQQEIEENLAATGRNSLAARVFADQTKFWTEENPKERIKLMWKIWDNMVWTPGYAVSYADTKKQIRSWVTALVKDARSDYVKEHGYEKMIRESRSIKEKELESMPKRMRALQLRAWVSASRRSRS